MSYNLEAILHTWNEHVPLYFQTGSFWDNVDYYGAIQMIQDPDRFLELLAEFVCPLVNWHELLVTIWHAAVETRSAKFLQALDDSFEFAELMGDEPDQNLVLEYFSCADDRVAQKLLENFPQMEEYCQLLSHEYLIKDAITGNRKVFLRWYLKTFGESSLDQMQVLKLILNDPQPQLDNPCLTPRAVERWLQDKDFVGLTKTSWESLCATFPDLSAKGTDLLWENWVSIVSGEHGRCQDAWEFVTELLREHGVPEVKEEQLSTWGAIRFYHATPMWILDDAFSLVEDPNILQELSKCIFFAHLGVDDPSSDPEYAGPHQAIAQLDRCPFELENCCQFGTLEFTCIMYSEMDLETFARVIQEANWGYDIETLQTLLVFAPGELVIKFLELWDKREESWRNNDVVYQLLGALLSTDSKTVLFKWFYENVVAYAELNRELDAHILANISRVTEEVDWILTFLEPRQELLQNLRDNVGGIWDTMFFTSLGWSHTGLARFLLSLRDGIEFFWTVGSENKKTFCKDLRVLVERYTAENRRIFGAFGPCFVELLVDGIIPAPTEYWGEFLSYCSRGSLHTMIEIMGSEPESFKNYVLSCASHPDMSGLVAMMVQKHMDHLEIGDLFGPESKILKICEDDVPPNIPDDFCDSLFQKPVLRFRDNHVFVLGEYGDIPPFQKLEPGVHVLTLFDGDRSPKSYLEELWAEYESKFPRAKRAE